MGTGSNSTYCQIRSVVPTHQGATVRILVVVRPEAVTNLVSQSHDGVVFARLDVVVDEGHEGRVESKSQISYHLHNKNMSHAVDACKERRVIVNNA